MKNTPFVFVLSDSRLLVHNHDNVSTHPSTGPSNSATCLIELSETFVLLQEYINMLMPPLINKWNVLKDEDKDLFPLLEVTLDLYRLDPVDLVL